MFIQKKYQIIDNDGFYKAVNNIIETVGFNTHNQIGLKSIQNSNNIWFDSVGSLYDKKTGQKLIDESEFKIWNVSKDNIIRTEIERLSKIENIEIGRIRLMRLNPHCGLSVHKDDSIRYHIVIKTNKKSYICHNDNENDELIPIGRFYHIPKDNHWYMVNTKETHWVYNGGSEERIHLVLCAIKK
jgi:hypothetical protein